MLLAGLDADSLDACFAGHPLLHLTPKTVTDETTIRASIAQTRRRGYARLSDGHVLGTAGVAAPVVRDRRVIAGLAVIAPSARFARQADHIVDATASAARELSSALTR